MPCIRPLFLFAILLLSPGDRAHAQGGCVQAAIEPGRSETFIFGIAPPEDIVCYSLATTPGQTFALKVVNGKNIILNVVGIRDGVDEVTFTARRRAYEVRVSQLMRSITREAFRIRVSLGGPAARPGQPPAGQADVNSGNRAQQRAKVLRYIQAWLRAQNAPEENMRNYPMDMQLVDLDGDGISEALVIVRDDVQCVPTGCPVLVLDLREANARNLGEFWAHAVKALPTSNNGWRDLSAGGKRVTVRGGRDR
jgi:hypothetical protein